jgi:signal peptidase I
MSFIDRVIDFLTARRVTIAEESMLPTLRPGNRVVFSGRGARGATLNRGDIVLVRAPGAGGRLDVKRVVGLPGETVLIRGPVVQIDGKPLPEPYLAEWAREGEGPQVEFQAGDREYVVLSDNRVHPGAVDFRRYGPIARERIVGVMVRRF